MYKSILILGSPVRSEHRHVTLDDMLHMSWIGKELFISEHTVRTHIQNILEKLGMHSKVEAAAFALQRSTQHELTSSELA